MADILIRGMGMPKSGYIEMLLKVNDGEIYYNYAGDKEVKSADFIPLPEGHERVRDTIDAIAQKVYTALNALDRGANNDWARAALEEANQILDAYYKKEINYNG